MNQKTLLLLSSIFILFSCEGPYFPETSEEDQEFVVEAFVEAGEGASVTYALITKSLPYLAEIGPDVFENLFVDDATVVINDGDKDVTLTALCLNDLPEEVREEAASILGLNADSTTLNICAYVDLFAAIKQEEGRTYTLEVSLRNGNKITGSTTIPELVPLTNFTWDDPPGEPSDSIANLLVTIDDPVGPNFYRYLTAQRNEPLTAPFVSVTDDVFFDGQEFEFPLTKAEVPGSDVDPNDFGFYSRGDSVSVKWATIDQAHFDFWNTRDNAASSGGPFSSYIRIKGNLDGALGIFGGYAVGNYQLYCPYK